MKKTKKISLKNKESALNNFNHASHLNGTHSIHSKYPPVPTPSILQDAINLISPLSATIQKSAGLINEITIEQENNMHELNDNLLDVSMKYLEDQKNYAFSQSIKKNAICDQMLDEVTNAMYWIEFYMKQVEKEMHAKEIGSTENANNELNNTNNHNSTNMTNDTTSNNSKSKREKIKNKANDEKKNLKRVQEIEPNKISIPSAKKSSKSKSDRKSSDPNQDKLNKLINIKMQYENKKNWPALVNENGESYNEELVKNDEEKFCYCQRVSFGKMIGCDNEETCEYKWFHFACINIHKEPKGVWYCPSCNANIFSKKLKKS